MSCNRRRQHLKGSVYSEEVKSDPVVQIKCSRKPKPQFNQAYLKGPGRALKHIMVSRFGVQSCDKCHATAKEMDKAGPDEVLAKLDYFAEQLHINAQERKWLKVLDFVEYNVFKSKHYKSLIREAVNLHRIEVAKREEYLTSPKQGA